MKKLLVGVISLSFFSSVSLAIEDPDPALTEIINFRQYSERFASAGQPTREQFQTIAEQGLSESSTLHLPTILMPCPMQI